ncbi:hypothetical protein, partial, partial [Parasitella parasitica]
QQQQQQQPVTRDQVSSTEVTVIQHPPQPTLIQHQHQSQTHYTVPEDGILPGGRLTKFINNWKKITNQTWPLSVVQHGYQLQFVRKPSPWKVKKIHHSPADQLAVDAAVDKFLKAGIIYQSPTQSKDYLSNFFTVQELTKRRPILDCTTLNKYLQIQHFKMEGIPALREIIEKDDYMCKIDLKDAYVVVPIHKDSQPYLALENRAPTRTWIPDKQGKECTYSEQGPRVFGIHNKCEDHDDFSTTRESNQATSKDQTSREEPQSIMQVDSVLTRKNHSSDSSDFRSPITYTTYTTGFSKKSTNKPSSLGQKLHINVQSKDGDPMVETQFSSEEWVAVTPDPFINISSYDSCGRLGHRLGSTQQDYQQSWILDRKRKAGFDQRQGTDSDILCPPPARKKLKGNRDQPIYRQHNRIEIRNKIRRDRVSNLTRFGSQGSRSMQSSSPTSSLSSCGRDQEHRSGPAQQIDSAAVRIIDPENVFQHSEEEMGQEVENRCVRSISQSPTPKILEPPTRPICPPKRRFPTELDEKRHVHVSTLEANSTGFTETETRQDQGSNASNTDVANAVLVPNVTEDEKTEPSNNMENKSLEFDRMELINKKRRENGMTDDLIHHLSKTNRESTSKIYDLTWQKYADWCRTKHYDPEKYAPRQVLAFLQAFSHFAPSTLNGYRSSIASDLETWDTNVLTRYIHQNLSPSATLSLYDLQQKVTLLLCLHTMWRPRSDIGRLQFRDTMLRYSEDQSLVGAILHIRQPKEAQQKTIQLGLLEEAEQVELCVVRCLDQFIQQTSKFRQSLPTDHTLLLTHLNKPNEITPNSIQPKTAAVWVQTHMLKAGISKEYTAHSIRAASSTKAVQQGVSRDKVKQHANWSLNSNTFEKYYYKPVGQEHDSTIIQNSIFSTAENRTTSESEAKATRIVEGTTYN